MPNREHETWEGDKEFLCDPCFVEAINMALSSATEFKEQVLLLPCMNKPNKVTTRAKSQKT